jgi:hypothetical protein
MTRLARACYAPATRPAHPDRGADAIFGLRETLHEPRACAWSAKRTATAQLLARQLRPFDLDVVMLDAGLAASRQRFATRLLDVDAELSSSSWPINGRSRRSTRAAGVAT